MASFDTDYLIIGAGANGLAFADTLLTDSDADITLVDRRDQPGGHWNDAYPFVRLHQPSAFYGVNSLPLGTGQLDTSGHNAGLYELASGTEVTAYFQQVMAQRLLASGRVRFLNQTEFLGFEGGTATTRTSISGQQRQITVRQKLVDALHFSPHIPATHPPQFRVDSGARWVTPTGLASMASTSGGSADVAPASHYCIVGAGKTAMDVGVWLLESGVSPDAIHWVVPRDSWLINRRTTQPGMAFFEDSIGGQVKAMQAMAEATNVDDLFDRLEAAGQMLRIDRNTRPTMFHYAVMSEGEVKVLRRIQQVIRLGRVTAIEPDALVLERGRVAMPRNTVYVHCTASAIRLRGIELIFQPGRVVPQLVRAPLVSFSAAVCAHVEATCPDDAAKNHLCTPVPLPGGLAGYVHATQVNMLNQMRWNQDKALRGWMRGSRLDGFGQLTASIAPTDTDKLALLGALREHAGAAMANASKLLAQAR
jgi:hypothetical protein